MHIKKLVAFLIVIVLAQLALGQVTYKSTVTSDGFMGMGAFTSNANTYIIDNAQRSETDLKFTGKFMRHFSPKGTQVSIIRLDKELVWNLDTEKKTYTEQTFGEIKEMMEQSAEGAEQPTPEENADYESDYNWSKPKVAVENLKESKDINGFHCNHYLATVTTIGTHKETGVKDTMLFAADLWNSKDVTKNMELVYDFNKRYLKAIGIDVPENAGLAMISGMYQEQMQILEDEIQKLDGYAIINDMKLTMTKNAIPEEGAETEDDVTLRDIQRDFGGLLGKKLVKKATDKKKEEKKSSVTELFHMKTEVTSISAENIADTKFEVGKGYKLKK